MSKLVQKPQADIVEISPEYLSVAETYLKCQDIEKTALALGIPKERAAQIISKREVKQYIDTVYMDYGYRNRFKLGAALDKIIDKKMEELDEAEIGSSKDILDILTLAHKFRMEEMAAATKLIEAQNKQQAIKNQTNIQINEQLPQGNYGDLIAKLLSPAKM